MDTGDRAKASAAKTEFIRRARSCDIVRFTLGDINGLPRTKLVNGTLVDDFIENGMKSWAGVVVMGPQADYLIPKEVVNINNGNVTVIPNPTTFHEVKWAKQDGLTVGEVNIKQTFYSPEKPKIHSLCYFYCLRHLIATVTVNPQVC